MSDFPKIFNDLVLSFARFPGVGRRSAERMAFYALKMNQQDLDEFIDRIKKIRNYLKPCLICNNFSSQDTCSVCADPKRDKEIVCIVQGPKDIMAIEKTGQYNGLYYILMDAISPLEGVTGEDLQIGKLLNRLRQGQIKEVVIATNPDNNGELTAQYLVEKIAPFGVKIFRIAIGIPLGTQIEYVDSSTLGKALQDKKVMT